MAVLILPVLWQLSVWLLFHLADNCSDFASALATICLTSLPFCQWLFRLCQWHGNYLFNSSSVFPMAVQILPVTGNYLFNLSSVLPIAVLHLPVVWQLSVWLLFRLAYNCSAFASALATICLTSLPFRRLLFCICQWSGNYQFDFSSISPMAVLHLPVVWQLSV